MILFLLAFLLTVIIELLIIYLITKHNWKELLGYVILINCFTWPLAIIALNFGINFYLVEFNVVIIESVLFMELLKNKYGYCLMLSFFANFITAGMSFLI